MQIKSIEVYGFVGWICSFILFVIYILWSVVPTEVQLSLGLSQLPNKSWAMALPSIIVVTLMFVILFGQGMHMIQTKEIDDVSIIQDGQSKLAQSNVTTKLHKKGIPEVYDIPINVVNKILYDKYK